MKVVIIGAGGLARGVLDILEAATDAGADIEVLGYVVDREYGEQGTVINSKPILGDFGWLADNAGKVAAICAVGASHHRRALVERATAIGVVFTNAIHPSVIMTRWVEIGLGVVIAAGTILTNRIRIGHHVHINLMCTVGHDCHLDDFGTLSPGVNVCGNVWIREGAFLGAGATTVEKVTIGAWSRVGAGAVVTKDVPDNCTVVGVPGRVARERPQGWQLAL